MADDHERFEAEIDLDVSFNEFDEELSESNEGNCDPNVEAVITNDKETNTKQHSSIFNFTKDTCELAEDVIPNVSHGNCSGNEKNLVNMEDGEISVSSDSEDGEKMDFDQGIGVGLNPVQTATNSAETSKETTADNFTFLPPSSVVENLNKNERLNAEFTSNTTKCVDETESANVSMESDNSMDDQSWKRHKRAKLEHGSLETGQEEKNYGEDYKTVKKRGGRKKRKRPLHDRPTDQQRCGNYNQRKPKIGKLFEPLKVTSDDSEEAVAKEIAEKLNESKTMLIQRVVRCIGCEKALKLFKDTKEIQNHGGMWTNDRQRWRTSGGVFLALLKNRYATKEQSKWIFAVENELTKKKAKE